MTKTLQVNRQMPLSSDALGTDSTDGGPGLTTGEGENNASGSGQRREGVVVICDSRGNTSLERHRWPPFARIGGGEENTGELHRRRYLHNEGHDNNRPRQTVNRSSAGERLTAAEADRREMSVILGLAEDGPRSAFSIVRPTTTGNLSSTSCNFPRDWVSPLRSRSLGGEADDRRRGRTLGEMRGGGRRPGGCER